MKKNNFLNYILIFLVVYLVMGFISGPKNDYVSTGGAFDVTTTKKEFEQNSAVSVKIRNNTKQNAVIKNECPNEPLTVFKKDQNEWKPITQSITMDCTGMTDTIIEPGKEVTIEYHQWAHSLFGEMGIYKISAQIEMPDAEVPADGKKSAAIESNEFQITQKGWLGTIWTAGFYQPIYNVLIFLISIIPGHDLGLAIILLTIIIRTILLIPSHRAMKSQRKLQELQPRLNHLKEKHKDNQETLARETMLLWKEHKVSPFGSCLPLFIQLPILIALFYAIQSGLNPDNTYLLYDGLKNFSLHDINVIFLWILDLTKINAFVLPLIVGGLQFIQMKLAMMRTEKKKETSPAKPEKEKKSEMEMANQMMIYFMPIMIALFTASVPAGVGLYWCVSTLYGIAQQYVVNRQVSTEKPDGVKVRVVK